MENFKITGIYALTAVVIALCLTVALYFLNEGEMPSGGEISLCAVVSLIVTFGFGAYLRRRQAPKNAALDAQRKTTVGLILLCSAVAIGTAACAPKELIVAAPPPPPPPAPIPVPPPPPPAPTPAPTPNPPPSPMPPVTAPPGDPAGPRPTIAIGRAFLFRGQLEDTAYGMFSYLLFPNPPATETQRERYKAAISAYLRTPPASDLAQDIAKQDLNVFYVPLSQQTRAVVDSVLKYYDYARATAILALIPGAQQLGPYLVSTGSPLRQTAPTDYLLQDLTVVFPTMVDPWVRDFKSAALEPRFWDSDKRADFVKKLRNVVAVTAAVIPGVQDSVKNWIKWVTG